jgi:hypothetical protein
VAPARQCLEPEHPAVDLCLRLIVEEELLAIQGGAQVELQSEAVAQAPVELGVEEAHRLAPAFLRPIESGVGIGEQGERVGPVVGIDGGADAEADGDVLSLDVERRRERLQEAVGQGLRRQGLLADCGNQGELVAADAGDECPVGCNFQAARNRAKQFVADNVAEHVVGFLEVVEVYGQYREALASRLGTVEHLGELGGKQGAIGQIGERIVVRQVHDLRVARKKLGARLAHVLARFVETIGSVLHPLLHDVEVVGHLAQFVVGVGLHRHYVDGRMGRVEVSPAKRSHRNREVVERSGGEPLGSSADLLRRVGDHARQNQPHADGEQGNDDKDISEHRHELGVVRLETVLTARR